MSSESNSDDQQVAAYYKWQRRGSPLWDDWTDWFATERERAEPQGMLGETYFIQRLGDIYSLSPIRYACGRGTLSDENDVIPVSWELNCDVTGSSVLVLSSPVMLDPNRMVRRDRTFREWRLEGRSLDERRTVWGEGILTPSMRFSFGRNSDVPRYFCHFRRIVIRDLSSAAPSSLTAYVSNLHFVGLEWTVRVGRHVADSFSIGVADRRIRFQLQDQHELLQQLIQIGRIDRALLSTITVPVEPGEALEVGLDVLDRIEWLSAVLTQNRTFSPVVRLDRDGENCGWIVSEVNSAPFISGGLVDNHAIPGGLKTTIEAVYDRFALLDARIDLRRFVDMLLVVAQQKHGEFKLSGLILAFEYLCTRLLKDYGRPPAPETSIQDKLRMLNGFLRFIPRTLLDDKLRADIRNPLFHTGMIVGADVPTLWSWYTRYYDLIIQILFVVLHFRGDYLSPVTNSPQHVPVPQVQVP